MPPHTVIFDLGVVLLHLEYEPALRRCIPLCDPERLHHGESHLKLLGRTPLVDAYERGEMTARAFFDRFVESTGFRGDFDEFASIWRGIFRENRPMIDFARRVAQRAPVYIMTNASDLHVPWVFERYPDLRFFRDYASSWEMRAAKPDAAYYERALARFGIPAADAVLIDDRPENVEGAIASGLHAVLYRDPDQAIGETLNLLNWVEHPHG